MVPGMGGPDVGPSSVTTPASLGPGWASGFPPLLPLLLEDEQAAASPTAPAQVKVMTAKRTIDFMLLHHSVPARAAQPSRNGP
jgi:hypothetical protein